MTQFSVITVCLNARKTLERTLQSLRAQTFKDFEYVVMDGGSTDGTLDLLKSYGDVVTHLHSGPDAGISDAFNRGLQRATGNWVAMINADDWYNPDTLHHVAAAAAAKPNADVICGRLAYWNEDGTPGAVFDARPQLLRSFMSVNHMATFARRSVFDAHGGFRTDMRAAMDYELVLRWFANGAVFAASEHVLANMSLGGVSDRRWQLAIKEVRQAQRMHGVGPAAAWTHWAFALAKGTARRSLEKVGGQNLIRFYREHLARVKKRSAG